MKQITITALRRKLKGLYFSCNVKFVIKKAKDKIHNLYINRKSWPSSKTTHDLEEFWRQLQEKFTNTLFHLSSLLELTFLECLLQLPKAVEVEGQIQTRCWMLQYLATHMLHLDLDGVHYMKWNCLHQSFNAALTQKYCHTQHASANKSLLLVSPLRPKTESQQMVLPGSMWNVKHHVFTCYCIQQSHQR